MHQFRIFQTAGHCWSSEKCLKSDTYILFQKTMLCPRQGCLGIYLASSNVHWLANPVRPMIMSAVIRQAIVKTHLSCNRVGLYFSMPIVKILVSLAINSMTDFLFNVQGKAGRKLSEVRFVTLSSDLLTMQIFLCLQGCN